MESQESALDIQHIRQLFGNDPNNNPLQQKLIDFLPIIVYISDPENKKVNYINKRITDLLGYSTEDINKWENGFMHIVFKDDIEAVQKEVTHILSIGDDKTHNYNTRLVNKKGEFRYFKTFGVPYKRNEEGKASSLLFFLEDITEKTVTENELKQARALMNDTETMLQYGLYTYDIKSDSINWSDGLFEIFEFEKDKRPPKISLELFLDHLIEDDRDWYRNIIKDAIDKKRNYEYEYHIITAKGNKKTLNTIGKMVLDDEGRVDKIIGSIRDITTIRLYEDELKRNVIELNRSNKELEEFAYVASHDMQEPLRKITTFSERLQNKYKKELSNEAGSYLDRISAAALNMRILIDNLLEFSRVGTEKAEVEKVNLNNILKQVIKDLELKIEESKIDIKIGKLPTILSRPSQMLQLFNNLISNAIKFRNEKVNSRITITSEKAERSELEKYHLPNGKTYHKIQVSDNGIGFSNEHKDRIFLIFQRLHGKSEYAGSGIGLSICKKIVEHCHGIIFAEGATDEGATFTIILPEQP